MNLELYKYGISNILNDVRDYLAEVLNTKDKKVRENYINRVYGMIDAMDMLVREQGDQEE